MQANMNPRTLLEVQDFVFGGQWKSLSVELRPFEDRTGSGKIESFYVKRLFEYYQDNKFMGEITSFADPFGQMPLVKFVFKGHTKWGRPHAIAEGAFEIDYVLDEAFEVTPLHPMFADNLNQAPIEGLQPFEVHVMQDIKGKAFPLFGIVKGQIVIDYDLIYINEGMLFMGAKHVDGKGFDKPENRPTNLQIPLIRK